MTCLVSLEDDHYMEYIPLYQFIYTHKSYCILSLHYSWRIKGCAYKLDTLRHPLNEGIRFGPLWTGSRGWLIFLLDRFVEFCKVGEWTSHPRLYIHEIYVHEIYVHEIYVHAIYVHAIYVHEIYVHEKQPTSIILYKSWLLISKWFVLNSAVHTTS